MKGKVKGILSAAILLALVAGAVAIYLVSQNWTIRYKNRLDAFFGEGNWECVATEKKRSTMYEEHGGYRSRRHRYSHVYNDRTVSGTYRNWDIQFTDREGEVQLARITDHAQRINNSEHWVLSSKRYSVKQALTLELMNIAFEMAGEQVRRDIVESFLTEEESGCMRVTISYHGGNPMPRFYNKLARQPWFKADKVTAQDFLAYNEHDFYIDILVYDYRLEALTPRQQENVLNSFEDIKEKLLDTYGADASFEMYFDKEHRAEFENGKVSD